MDLNALKAAVLGSGSVTAPAVNTNSTGANAFVQSAIGHIQNLAGLTDRAQATGNSSNALYGGVKQQASIDASNAQNAHDQAVATAKQQAADAQAQADAYSDPSKYQKIVNNSGGYDFYAPDGSKISAQDYANVTGKHVTDVVKGSQNTTDQEFLQDYKEVTALGTATQQGGKALAAYLKKNPELADQLKQNKLTTYADVVKNFRSSYPQYFPQPSVNDIGNASYNNTQVQAPAGNGIFDKIKGAISGIL